MFGGKGPVKKWLSKDSVEKSNKTVSDFNPSSYYVRGDTPLNPKGHPILDTNAKYLPNDLLETNVFTTEEDQAFLTSKMMKLPNAHMVSSELLKRCLTNDVYYSFARHNMLSEAPKNNIINLARLFYDNTEQIKSGLADYVVFTSIGCKSDFVKGLVALKDSGQLDDLSDEERNREMEFRAIVSPRSFFEKIKGTLYDVMIDGKRCTVPVDSMIKDFLLLPEDKLSKLCTTNPDGKIGQLSKAEFAYAVASFLKKKQALSDYLFPKKFEDRMNKLLNGDLIDFSAINYLNETKETLHKKVNINPELRKAVLDQMPKDFTELEKAIYIYLKMCMILTYDNRFYAANDHGEIAKKHKNLDYIGFISPTNNEVVCYEFNLIYAKFIDELGLNFRSMRGKMNEEDYGDGHESLIFRAGRFIIKADSVRSALRTDMTKAKLGLPVTGLTCENGHETTEEEFNNTVLKVYKLIQQQEKKKISWNKYDLLTENLNPVPFSEKKSILFDALSTSSLRGTDAMAYALKLKEVLFDRSGQSDNISVVVLRNNRPTDLSDGFEAGAIIAINEDGLHEHPDKTDFRYLSSKGEFIPLTPESIIAKLKNGTFEYIRREFTPLTLDGIISKLEDGTSEYIDSSTPTISGATKDEE